MGKEGFDNETIIMNELDGFTFKDLKNTLQKFLQFMFNNKLKSNDIIYCSKKAGQNKSDIEVSSRGESHTVSIKSGTGNSVHQEPIEEFIKFLESNYDISDELANDLRRFIWGDETLDGSGKISHRLSAHQFKKKYPDVVARIKNFFYSHKKDLIKRFVIKGSKSASTPEFIYYEDKRKRCWEKSETVLTWLVNDNNESNGAVPAGRLTFQAWNRNINGGNRSERKRGVIQLKWGSVGNDLDLIMKKIKLNKGTSEGTEEEISFVKKLNKKNNAELWKIMGRNPNKCFAIHITSHKFGKINKSKIKAKADVYIASGKVPQEFIKKNEYYLDENDAKRFNLNPIHKTGISVKRKDSRKYQILKMNPNTVKKIFGNYELGGGASLYCKKPEELEKNTEVLRGWKTTWKAFTDFFKDIKGIEKLNDKKSDINNRLSIARKVKTKCNKEIKSRINNNKKISDFVFQGIGNFEEPFIASWFYELGKLKKSGKIPFVVTTGSGRSRGDFTIVIKPKNSTS